MPELIPEWVDLELLEAAACLNARATAATHRVELQDMTAIRGRRGQPDADDWFELSLGPNVFGKVHGSRPGVRYSDS